MTALPMRGEGLRSPGLPLPPARMPALRAGRPLKRWRWIGVFLPELTICGAQARVGPMRQSFWAVAQPGRPLLNRTTTLSRGLAVRSERLLLAGPLVSFDLALDRAAGVPAVETVSPHGAKGYIWTRKQAGAPVRGSVWIEGRWLTVEGEAVIDETAGYHARETAWSWSAGVGRGSGGERIGWNLVEGVGDLRSASERTIWVDGQPREVGPVRFAPDVSRLSFEEGGELRQDAVWSAREHRTNALLVRSDHRMPFGTFSGELPGGLALAEGRGVMERHEARW